MTNYELDFTGKVVLVTGGSTGIGRATACAFATRGARVAIGDMNAREGAETADLIRHAGGQAVFVPADVSDPLQVENLVAETVKQFGALHCAFNNAGIPPAFRPLCDQSEEEFERVIAVDLKGIFLCMKYEIPVMVRHGGGTIVNTASVAGLIADPHMAPYVAAKHGVIGLTKAAAIDYAESNIRVNALAPGVVDTRMTELWLDDPKMRSLVLSRSFLGRAAKPEEMSGMVLFLCSDLATFITGQTFLVDGGLTAR